MLVLTPTGPSSLFAPVKGTIKPILIFSEAFVENENNKEKFNIRKINFKSKIPNQMELLSPNAREKVIDTPDNTFFLMYMSDKMVDYLRLYPHLRYNLYLYHYRYLDLYLYICAFVCSGT